MFSTEPATNEPVIATPGAIDTASIGSVAYLLPEAGHDVLFVRRADGTGGVHRVASLPYAVNLHARGRAAPSGDLIAILSIADLSKLTGRLSLVRPTTAELSTIEGDFDYTSAMAWSPNGMKLALVRSEAADQSGRMAARVLEVDAATWVVASVARFESAFMVAPVGYSLDAARLFIVVVDPAGSSLWSVVAGRIEKVGTLSSARTRDWTLSPDGARLAYIEIRGAGEEGQVGKTYLVAAGAVVSSGASAGQLGVAWEPGSAVAQFGGPGGTVRLSAPSPNEAYVVPFAWAPAGGTLVAAVCLRAGVDEGCAQSIEIVSADRRLRLAEQEGVQFIGWTRNVE